MTSATERADTSAAATACARKHRTSITTDRRRPVASGPTRTDGADSRRFRVAVFATITMLATLAPATAGAERRAPEAAVEASEAMSIEHRLTERRLLRLLPNADEVGSGPTTDGRSTGVPLVCLQLGTGPAARLGVSRAYRIDDAFVQVFVRAYRDEATARRALRVQRRDVFALCDGSPYFGYIQEYRRGPVALRDFGDQRWGLVREFVAVDDGYVPQTGIEGAYRVGRYLVLYETSEPSNRVPVPDSGRPGVRRILTIVRDRIAALPGAG